METVVVDPASVNEALDAVRRTAMPYIGLCALLIVTFAILSNWTFSCRRNKAMEAVVGMSPAPL